MPFEQQVADYEAALSWVGRLMSTTASPQLGRPTPCDQFTVRDLLGHLIGTAYRGLGTARGEPTSHVPHVVTNVSDQDLARAYATLAGRVRQAWRTVAGPDQSVIAPWGECSAHRAVEGFTVETLVHGWDLAMATDRDPEALSAVAVRCLSFVGAVVPARLRGLMYDEPAPATGDDGPTTQLARHLGRR